jgi:hypothetical protein
MARIPLGDFGNAILKPGPQVQQVAGAFDNGGAALQALGDKGIAIAGDMQAERLAEEKRIAAEAKREREALERARAANDLLDHEISIKSVGQEIEQGLTDGSIRSDEADAIYRERLQGIQKPDAAGYDPVTAMNLERGIKRTEFNGETGVAKSVGAAQKVEFRANIDGIMDKLGKKASLPDGDPATLAEQIQGMDEAGSRAYGAAWPKKKQDWIDGNWDAHLNQKAMAVVDNLDGIKALKKQITDGDYADKLDSNRRNTLVAKLEGYRTSLLQRQEVAAARAERQNERYMRQAEAEFNTFQALADKGTIIAPAYIDRAARRTAGTPYQAGIVAIAQQARETGGIAAQPVRVQEAMLTQIDREIAQNGRTPELDKRREQVKKVLDGSQSDLKENGLRAGLERGVITDIPPIDTSNPEALAVTIGARLEQAEIVGTWAGKAVSPLDAREAEQLRTMLDSLPAKARAQAVATIADAVGPIASRAMAQQLDGQDKALGLAFASSGSKTTAGRYTSELILKGDTAMKDGVVMKDDKKVTGWKASIATAVDGAFPDERASGAVKEAAYLIAAGIAAENGGSVGSSDIERAVRIAVGGKIIERNGKKLPVPAGIDDFEDSIRNVPVSDIVKQAPSGTVIAGGAEIPVADFAKSIPGQELVYAGPGRYAVIVRGRPVTNSAGQRIYIKVR